MPPHVLEKMFDVAVEDDESDENVLIGLCKLSEVCVGWRNSILSSTKLFANCKIYGSTVKNELLYRQLVKTGLVNKIKNIKIWCPKGVEMLVEDMGEKSLSEIILAIDGNWSDEVLDRLLQFLSSCSNVTTVIISFEMADQRMAVWYWKILQKVINCNQQPKNLHCEIHSFPPEPIDWQFIKDLDFHGCGLIKNLNISVYSVHMLKEWPDWTYLADAVSIEQVTIHEFLYEDVLGFYKTLKAKRIDVNEFELTRPMTKFFNNFESLYIHDCWDDDIGKINHQNAHAVCDFAPQYFVEDVENLSALAEAFKSSCIKTLTFSLTQTTFDCDDSLFDNWIDHARADKEQHFICS